MAKAENDAYNSAIIRRFSPQRCSKSAKNGPKIYIFEFIGKFIFICHLLFLNLVCN